MADQPILTRVQGAANSGVAASGAPVQIGGEISVSSPAAGSDGDQVGAFFDAQGRLIVGNVGSLPDEKEGTANATGTADTQIIAAPGAGDRLYIMAITVVNTSVTNTSCLIKSATTEVYRLPAPANGGHSVTFPFPLRLGDNQALQFAAEAGVTTMYVSAVGFVASV